MSLTALLCDKDTDETIADLTPLCQSTKLSLRLSRPRSVVLTLPADQPEIRGLADDGLPVVQPGKRTLKIVRDGILRANCLLWNVAPSGDENTSTTTLTGLDPLILLQKRWVRDITGNLVDPTFDSPISGPSILAEVIETTQDAFGDQLPFEVFLAPYDVSVPPAVDVSAQLTNWPIKIGDLMTLLTESGVCDVVMDPVDHAHLGRDPGVLGVAILTNHYGSDLSSVVHFDYGTGDNSIASVRRSFDMDELCNWLIYYLGPKLDKRHWRGSIDAGAPGLEDVNALAGASFEEFGLVYEDIVIHDDSGFEASARPLFTELFKTELTLRVQPRELLFLRPMAGDGCPFKPFDDYGVGDVVGVNVADIAGPEILGGKQRIYGFDIDQGTDGVERVGEFAVSPDGV